MFLFWFQGSLRDEVQPQRGLHGVEVDRRQRLLAVQVGRRSGRQEDGEVRQQPDATHGVERKQLRKQFQLKLKTKKTRKDKVLKQSKNNL